MTRWNEQYFFEKYSYSPSKSTSRTRKFHRKLTYFPVKPTGKRYVAIFQVSAWVWQHLSQIQWGVWVNGCMATGMWDRVWVWWGVVGWCVWVCGRVWVCGYMGVWSVGVWVFGCLGLWLSGFFIRCYNFLEKCNVFCPGQFHHNICEFWMWFPLPGGRFHG